MTQAEDLEAAAQDEIDRACTLAWRDLAAHTPWGDTFEGFTPGGREVAFEVVVVIGGRGGGLVEQGRGHVLGPLARGQDAD